MNTNKIPATINEDTKPEQIEFEVNEDFIESLNDFQLDHVKHFDCLATEFEYENMVFDFDDFISFVKEDVSDLITAPS